MNVDTTSRINAAIQDCLAQCYRSDNPVMRVAQYVRRLHADRSWTDREITYVEIAVLKLLRLIVN